MSAATATILTGIGIAATTGTAVYQGIRQGQAADTQANAVRDSTAAQTASQNQATLLSAQNATDASNFQRQVYNDRSRALAPYRNVGTNAFSSLAHGFGLPTNSGSPDPTPAAMLPQPTLANLTGQPATTGTSSGAMVTMQSPDGREQRQVPADQEAYWRAKGARRIS